MAEKRMKPIFIGGTGRSGTTILKQVLLHHPNIVGMADAELRVLTDPGGGLDLILALSRDWTPYKADYAIQTFQRLMSHAGARASLPERLLTNLLMRVGASPRRYIGLNLADRFGRAYFSQRLARLIDDLTYHISPGRWVGSPSYRLRSRIYEVDPLPFSTAAARVGAFFHDLYTHLARRQGKDATHWLDDTPYNLLRADLLMDTFLEMKFIHIYRDPRDVLASYIRQDWGGDDVVATARRLANTLATWERIRTKLPASAYLEVAFEDLARSPGEQLARMIAFLDLPDYHFREDELSLIDPDRAHIGRWKEEIPPEVMVRAMNYLAPWGERYGSL